MNLDAILSNVNTIGISGHIRPDGDCVGSCMALYNYIKTYYTNIEVTLYLEEIPGKFEFLNNTNEIMHVANETKVYDAYFALDCSGGDRLGFALDMYNRAKIPCCIDHHISNEGCGEYMYIVPTASSTSELVYHLFDEDKITKEIAECLYLGIVHDTGVFQYSNVAPSTMRAAARLLETGIDASKLIEETYYEKTYLQNKMLGKAFSECQVLLNGCCISYGITWDEMQKYGVVPLDLDAIAAQLRNTQGVDIAIFMYALNEEEYKVSLRSNDKVDASVIAKKFQGGGHKKAAGFAMKETYEVARDIILDEIQKQI